MTFRCVIVICTFLAALITSGACASQTLSGIVLTVLAGKQQAVLRHEAYGGMPAMTMLFALSARNAIRLREGDRIEATVAERGDLETLSNVRVIAKSVTPQPDTLRSVALLKTGDALPAIPLIDQNGRSFTFADFRGKTIVLSFIYTRCRDARMCPLISAHFHQLEQRLDGNKYHLV